MKRDRSEEESSPFLRRWRDATALDPATVGGRRLDWHSQPPPHKSYPASRRLGLPRPEALEVSAADLWELLSRRRSRREFTGEPISFETLAALVWACQGVTARQGPYLLRTAPSAGALFPFETYVSVQATEGVDPCLAHLHVPTFSLEILEEGHLGRHLANASLGQGFVARASAVFVWTVVLPRSSWKYATRSLRYVGLDLGHVCQNLVLAAEALGLGCCPVAAFFDAELNRVLGVDGEDEFAYYLAAVGPLARAGSPPSR